MNTSWAASFYYETHELVICELVWSPSVLIVVWKFKKYFACSKLDYRNLYILHYKRFIRRFSITPHQGVDMRVVYVLAYWSQDSCFDCRLPRIKFFLLNSGFIRQIYDFQPDFLWWIFIRDSIVHSPECGHYFDTVQIILEYVIILFWKAFSQYLIIFSNNLCFDFPKWNLLHLLSDIMNFIFIIECYQISCEYLRT